MSFNFNLKFRSISSNKYFLGREILDSNPKCWINKKILELGEFWVPISNIYVNYEGQLYGTVQKTDGFKEQEIVYTATDDLAVTENPFDDEDEDSDEVSTDDEVSIYITIWEASI